MVIINWIGFVLGILFAGLIYFKRQKEKVLFESFLEIHAFYSWSLFTTYICCAPPFIHTDFIISSSIVLLSIASIHVLVAITFIGIYQYLEQMIDEIKARNPHYNFSNT